MLLRSMSSSEISEAMAFYKIEPYGEWRDDYRAAMLASVTANCHAGSKSRQFQPSDFMPDFSGEAPKRKLVDDIKEAFNLGNPG